MTRDPGLPSERTRLAWRRTLLALTGVTVLLVRLASAGNLVAGLLGGMAVVAWLAMLTLNWYRATGTGPRRGEPLAFPLTALTAAGLALLGVLLVVAGLR